MTVNAITDTKKGRTGIAPTYLHTTLVLIIQYYNCTFALFIFRLHKLGIEAHAYAHYTSLLCFALSEGEYRSHLAHKRCHFWCIRARPKRCLVFLKMQPIQMLCAIKLILNQNLADVVTTKHKILQKLLLLRQIAKRLQPRALEKGRSSMESVQLRYPRNNNQSSSV